MPQMLPSDLITGKCFAYLTSTKKGIDLTQQTFRKSAAWSGSDMDDDFMTFGDSMYSDSASQTSNVLNSVSFTRNRAKITNPKVYIYI